MDWFPDDKDLCHERVKLFLETYAAMSQASNNMQKEDKINIQNTDPGNMYQPGYWSK